MSMFWLVLLLILNFGISWWNAYVAGLTWAETKILGGFMRMVTWSAAIMSACGFTMVFSFLLAGAGYAVGLLDYGILSLILHLTYLTIILPILGSGLIITIHSWIVAYRERSILDMGIAGYNTLAMAHNAYSAVDGIGEAFKAIGSAIKDDDSDNKIIAAIIIVVIALGSGVALTYSIIKAYAGTMPLPDRSLVRS